MTTTKEATYTTPPAEETMAPNTSTLPPTARTGASGTSAGPPPATRSKAEKTVEGEELIEDEVFVLYDFNQCEGLCSTTTRRRRS